VKDWREKEEGDGKGKGEIPGLQSLFVNNIWKEG
jgi:hypothetical protein